MRVGATHGSVSADIFVTNLFDDKAYTSIADQYVFTNNFAYTSKLSAVVVGLPERRTVGLLVKYRY
ncbi:MULTISPECIES: hypothetical protein [unclassified Azospirillum]|uniref:hypothetical protein n=1 Tax=unclassified Azospirillum TaxID=2630922 RepID=UPI000B6E4C51|nr:MULTISPECIES: hypothetical protein [unclassified Azospirillum]SNS82538.1 hypothetical protein SAMN05880556_112140 [Azospirillum sp. RU38E]SNS99726.1 hypothetical protein SAMN05880591_112140 [Azospirillum sp. RU37A]